MMFPAIDGPAGMTLGARDNEDRLSAARPRAARTSETAQHSADVAPRCADAPPVDSQPIHEAKPLTVVTGCAQCGSALPRRARADRRFCSGACRVARLRDRRENEAALARVARERLAELRAEGRKPTPTPALYPPEEGRR